MPVVKTRVAVRGKMQRNAAAKKKAATTLKKKVTTPTKKVRVTVARKVVDKPTTAKKGKLILRRRLPKAGAGAHHMEALNLTTASPEIGKPVLREVWRVPIDGKIKMVVTSASTVQTMDEAVRVFDRILERLANK